MRFDGDSAIFAIPDTIRIPVNASADIQKVTISIRPDNSISSRTITLYENGMPTAADVNMDIIISEALGNDAAIHPLHIESVKFFIASTTPKQQHTIATQGIWLLSAYDGDALPQTQDERSRGVRKVLTPDGIRIIKDGKTYTLLGI